MQKIIKKLNYLLLSFVSVYICFICFICQNCIISNLYNEKPLSKFFVLVITSFFGLIIYDLLFMLIDKTIREKANVYNIENGKIISREII